jgi:hypothetical protein
MRAASALDTEVFPVPGSPLKTIKGEEIPAAIFAPYPVEPIRKDSMKAV